MDLTKHRDENGHLSNLPTFDDSTSAEKTLVNHFTNYLEKNGLPRVRSVVNAQLIEEFNILGQRIADIVLVLRMDKSVNIAPDVLKLISQSPMAARIVISLFKDKTISYKELSEQFGTDPERTRKLYKIIKPEIPKRGYLIPNLELWAFEVKISDWKKGFVQADNYLNYANRSVLLLPGKTAELMSEKVEMFKSAGIGLWLFDEDKMLDISSLKILAWPKRIVPRSSEAYLRARAKVLLFCLR